MQQLETCAAQDRRALPLQVSINSEEVQDCATSRNPLKDRGRRSRRLEIDADETIARLIAILDRQDLAAAMDRLESGHGLRVVK